MSEQIEPMGKCVVFRPWKRPTMAGKLMLPQRGEGDAAEHRDRIDDRASTTMGVVTAVGPEVTKFKVGDEVFAIQAVLVFIDGAQTKEEDARLIVPEDGVLALIRRQSEPFAVACATEFQPLVHGAGE